MNTKKSNLSTLWLIYRLLILVVNIPAAHAIDWIEVTPGGVAKIWRGITSSADGEKLAAIAKDGAWISKNAGRTWTEIVSTESSKNWGHITSSSDFTTLAALEYPRRKDCAKKCGGKIWISKDSGLTWTDVTSTDHFPQSWHTEPFSTYYYSKRSSLSRFAAEWQMSSDGTELRARKRCYGQSLHLNLNLKHLGEVTNNYNGSFSRPCFVDSSDNNNDGCVGFASSSDGSKLAALGRASNLVWQSTTYSSNDNGVTWIQGPFSGQHEGRHKEFTHIISSSDGTRLMAVGDYMCCGGNSCGMTDSACDEIYGGSIFTSMDSGTTWTSIPPAYAGPLSPSRKNWKHLTISKDDTTIAGITVGTRRTGGRIGQAWISTNWGMNWTDISDGLGGKISDLTLTFTGDSLWTTLVAYDYKIREGTGTPGSMWIMSKLDMMDLRSERRRAAEVSPLVCSTCSLSFPIRCYKCEEKCEKLNNARYTFIWPVRSPCSCVRTRTANDGTEWCDAITEFQNSKCRWPLCLDRGLSNGIFSCAGMTYFKTSETSTNDPDIRQGNCKYTGGKTITSLAACKVAAEKLHLGRVEIGNGKGWGHMPPGCSMWSTVVHYNYNVASTRSCDYSSSKYCICTEGSDSSCSILKYKFRNICARCGHCGRYTGSSRKPSSFSNDNTESKGTQAGSSRTPSSFSNDTQGVAESKGTKTGSSNTESFIGWPFIVILCIVIAVIAASARFFYGNYFVQKQQQQQQASQPPAVTPSSGNGMQMYRQPVGFRQKQQQQQQRQSSAPQSRNPFITTNNTNPFQTSLAHVSSLPSTQPMAVELTAMAVHVSDQAPALPQRPTSMFSTSAAESQEQKDNAPPPLPPKPRAKTEEGTCKTPPPLTPRRRSTGGSSIEVVVPTAAPGEPGKKTRNPFDDFF